MLQVATGMLATTRKPRSKVVKRQERVKRVVEGYTSSNMLMQIPGIPQRMRQFSSF